MKTPKRIWILGPSGSGKTYLADKLSRRLKIKSYDLDNIYWKKKWDIKREDADIRKILRELAKKKKWIVEGIFSSWTEDGIKKADLVIWLDFHIGKLTWRMLLRHLKRRKDDLPQKWKDLLGMIRYTMSYKNKNARFRRYTKLIKKHKLNVAVIRNNKQLTTLIEALDL